MNAPEEPVAESASLARRLAPQLCRNDPVTGEDCSWYHGLWQDLRCVGLAASSAPQATFFQTAFSRLAGRNGPLRVLVSGSADYSILAQVLEAGQVNRLILEITVLDLCPTPLFLNQWYAERAGHAITTVREDIFNFAPLAPFDAVCSHSFLGQFAPEHRREVVARWAQLLAPQGMALTVNRVRPEAGREIKFNETQGREFCEVVERRIRESNTLAECEIAVILERTRLYVQHLRVWSITGAEMASLFQQNGFGIESLQAVDSGEARNAHVGGPGIPANARHACVVAIKGRPI